MDTDGARHSGPVDTGMLNSFLVINKVNCAVVPHRGGSITGQSVAHTTTTLHCSASQRGGGGVSLGRV